MSDNWGWMTFAALWLSVFVTFGFLRMSMTYCFEQATDANGVVLQTCEQKGYWRWEPVPPPAVTRWR